MTPTDPALEALNRTLLLSRSLFAPTTPDDSVIARHLMKLRACIVADHANIRTRAAQAMVSALVGMLAGYGCSLRFVLPEVPLAGPQPPLTGEEFRSALLAYAQDCSPAITASVASVASEGDFIFVIGDTHWSGPRGETWRLSAEDWSGRLDAVETHVARADCVVPFGSLASACLAAVEPFKAAMRGIASELGGATDIDFVRRVQTAKFSWSIAPTLPGMIQLGNVDLISAGAIGQAFVHALARVPGVSASIRVFDDQTLEVSNLNRYALARLSQVGEFKVDVIASAATDSLRVIPIRERLSTANFENYLPLAPNVVVGVDDVPSRWDIQRQSPLWLGVGSSAGFLTVTSDHWRGVACAGCAHPFDDGVRLPIPTASFVSYWPGLLLAARAVQRAVGSEPPLREQQVNLTALLLDSPTAVWMHEVMARSDCPVGCEASRAMRSN